MGESWTTKELWAEIIFVLVSSFRNEAVLGENEVEDGLLMENGSPGFVS